MYVCVSCLCGERTFSDCFNYCTVIGLLDSVTSSSQGAIRLAELAGLRWLSEGMTCVAVVPVI